MTSPKKIGPIFACFYPFFRVKLRDQVQDLQKREFYDLPEHGGLGTIQTSWARRAIKIMAVDSCVRQTQLSFTPKEGKLVVTLKTLVLWVIYAC